MAQLALFPEPNAGPAGLRYQGEFVSKATEQELISRICELPLKPFQFGAYEGKRRVASFGFRYDYTLKKLQQADPIPDWLISTIGSVEQFGGLPAGSVRQILCTEYDAGVGIGWHRDKPHFDQVFGLSLASACKFRFRRAAGEKWERFTLSAEPRSLYLMSGESRQVWEHSIPAVEQPILDHVQDDEGKCRRSRLAALTRPTGCDRQSSRRGVSGREKLSDNRPGRL